MTSLLGAALLSLGLLQAAAAAAQQQPPDALGQARAALAAIAAGNFGSVEGQFTDQMKAALPPGRLSAMWTALAVQAGAYKSCEAAGRLVAIADKQMVITACQFERAKVDVQLAFDNGGRISGMAFRPAAAPAAAYALPAYAKPGSYVEGASTVGSGEWKLPATLTVPAGAGPFPAVVLVHGSGPNDRDETVAANKPFADLAAGLASRGIAVLRYDKRSKVYGSKFAALAGFTAQQEVVEDALEAVKVLRAEPRVDRARIFVLGHSLGGMLVPRIATADPAIAGLIVLAGPARPLEEAIVAQMRYLAAADGSVSPEEQQGIDRATALADSVRALTPADAASGRMVSGAPASYWLDLRGYDPPAAAKQLKAPMLILQGGRDYQVTPEEFARWKAALGSRRDVTFHEYPALNHLFIAGTGPALPAEYQVPGHVAEDVVRDIATWIRAVIAPSPSRRPAAAARP
jgi:dienelactone hydrolase